MKYIDLLFLILIFLLQTLLILIFLPYLWELARIEIVRNRLLDQGLKALIFVILAYIWLYIFRLIYYGSYNRINKCPS